MPIVFAMGFWTHQALAPAQHVTASRGKGLAPLRKPAARDVVARDWKGDAAPLFYSAPPAPEPTPPPMNISLFNFGQVKPGEQSPDVTRQGRESKPAKISGDAPNVAAQRATETRATEIPLAETPTTSPVLQTAAVDIPPAPADGFTLRSPVAGQFAADVQVPGNSWFSLAGATADCESGICKLVRVKTADRKLNTLLEWAATPQQAAQQAASEGKQVFLIHVSGNFAQPGFT